LGSRGGNDSPRRDKALLPVAASVAVNVTMGVAISTNGVNWTRSCHKHNAIRLSDRPGFGERTTRSA